MPEGEAKGTVSVEVMVRMDDGIATHGGGCRRIKDLATAGGDAKAFLSLPGKAAFQLSCRHAPLPALATASTQRPAAHQADGEDSVGGGGGQGPGAMVRPHQGGEPR